MAVTRIAMKSLAKIGFCVAILFTAVAGKELSVVDLSSDGNVPSVNIQSSSALCIWSTQAVLPLLWSPEYSNNPF